jgi:hypothetical protein
LTLRAFRQRIERLEKVCAFDGFHIIEVKVGTPQLEEEAERYIAEQSAYAKSINKLPFVFRLNTARNMVEAV